METESRNKPRRVIAQRWSGRKLIWSGAFTGTAGEILTRLAEMIKLSGNDKVTWVFIDA